MKRFLFLLAGLALLAGMGRFDAQQPQADPYDITPQAGSWLICVASYTQALPGDPVEGSMTSQPIGGMGVKDAAGMAHDFAQEIRTKYKTAAYVYNRGGEERAKQMAEVEKLRERCQGGNFRTIRIREQYAVLVGGYKDSETAHKELERIHKWEYPDKRFCNSAMQFAPGPWDGKMKKLDPNSNEPGGVLTVVLYNPFASAFAVPNPLAPPERPRDDVADPFIVKLNEGEEFNLLKQCKHPYTMTVAVFQTPPRFQGHSGSSSFLDKLMGHDGGQSLAAGAMNAHNLAEVLRKIGFKETYVLHTRYNSLVTVGAYDTDDDRRMSQMWQALERQIMPPEVKAMLLSHPLPYKVPKS
jgi:hypothetical protein